MRIGGQQQPAIRIQVDPAKLVEKNLQLEDVRSQMAIATVDSPKGSINGMKQSYTIFDNDQLTEAKPWNDVIIAYRNGAPVRVRDIGVAVAGPVDTLQAAWSNGKRSVFLVVFKQPGVNVIKTVESIKKVLVRLEASISARHSRRLDIRPHHDDPRIGRGRPIHAVAHHRPRRDGDIRVPAQRLGDHHPERHRAARPAGRLRADVVSRL